MTPIVEDISDQLLLSDTGQGIHPDDLPHVFDRFYQPKQPDTKMAGGTGIGLSLCRELAVLLGGERMEHFSAAETGGGKVDSDKPVMAQVDNEWLKEVESVF